MATDLQNLITARSAITANIAQYTALEASGGPKPTYALNGQSVSWSEWLTARMADLKVLDDAIVRTQGPVLISTVAYPGGMLP